MFGLLKDKIPLVCWSQCSGYSLSVSIGSLYGVRPNQIPPKGKFSQKKTANYPYFVDKGGRCHGDSRNFVVSEYWSFYTN